MAILLLIKCIKNGDYDFHRCINIGGNWYEFTISPDDEQEYNEMLYFNLN